MTTKSGQEDAFKLHKISESMKYNILYVYSAIPFLMQFVKMVNAVQEEQGCIGGSTGRSDNAPHKAL